MAAGRSAAVGWATSFPLPILLSLLLLPLPLTVAQVNETLSLSPSFCQNATCPSGESPNPYLYNLSGGNSCNCSITVQLSLVLEQASISSWTMRLTRNLGRAFAAQLGINASQVSLQSVNTVSNRGIYLFLHFFPALSPWTLGQAAIVVASVERNASLLGPPFGSAYVLTTSLGGTTPIASQSPAEAPPAGTAPATPTSPPPHTSSYPGWAIGYIVIGAAIVLLLLAFLAWVWLRKGGINTINWLPNPVADMPRKESSVSRAQSLFNQKVQEYFVKEIPIQVLIDATDSFAEENVLGLGGYGTVYKGVAPDGTEWAVKRAKRKVDTNLEDFQNEVDVISKMSHSNLVRLLGYCDEADEQILVYEYVSNGNLREHIRNVGRYAGRTLTFEHRLEIAIGAAEGLRYLHSFAKPPIIHRDIKTDNILLDNDMKAKVADFGVFKHLQTGGTRDDHSLNTKVVGTPGYLDPEYYQTYKVTAKSDVYSFGVVLLELITGRNPIMPDPTSGNPNVMVTLARWAVPCISSGKVEEIVDPNLFGDHPRQALQMLASVAIMCLRRASTERPDMAEVATRLGEIKYFMQPSAGILEPVGSMEEAQFESLVAIPEASTAFTSMPGGYSRTISDIMAPISITFSDR